MAGETIDRTLKFSSRPPVSSVLPFQERTERERERGRGDREKERGMKEMEREREKERRRGRERSPVITPVTLLEISTL